LAAWAAEKRKRITAVNNNNHVFFISALLD